MTLRCWDCGIPATTIPETETHGDDTGHVLWVNKPDHEEIRS